jgi:hypothetical protein
MQNIGDAAIFLLYGKRGSALAIEDLFSHNEMYNLPSLFLWRQFAFK